MTEYDIYPKDYTSKDFSGVWDIKKIIQQIVELHACRALFKESDNLKILVKQKRLLSALYALSGKAYDDIEGFHLISGFVEGYEINHLSLDKINLLEVELKALNVDSKEFIHSKSNFGRIFNMVLQYRASIERGMNCFSGTMEAGGDYATGIKLSKIIYNNALENCNRRVDKILEIILSESLSRHSVTEQELIEKYNYPTITDSQVTEWIIENW